MAKTYQLKTKTVSRLGIDYAQQVSREQRAVVEAGDGPLLVLAGAGSGKTRALVYRVAKLIDRGTPPEGIYLLTFTNRAAREMVERVEELVGPTARQVLGGTFHHVANVLLRRYAEAIGYKSNFTILDRDDAREVMGASILDAGVEVRKGRFPKPDLVLDMASYAINTQTPVRDVVAKRAPRFFQLADDVAACCRAYIERKAAMNLMDFDDMLMNWRILLEEVPQVAERLQDDCKAILVDEYQDTNALQGAIVDLMAKRHRNITVVGDDAQCIYGFRGAEVRNMLDFPERYPGCRKLPLVVNYRSTPEILELANACLLRAKEGFQKQLRPVRPGGPLPALIPCRHVNQQAEFTAQRILELRDEGVPLDDIAVLYRAHSHSMEIQVELTRRGIPFIVRSGLRFFEQAHIKDVLSYLKLTFNPEDELSFRRAVKLHEGIGNATADELWTALAELHESGVGSFSAARKAGIAETAGKRARRGVEAFLDVVEKLADKKLQQQPGELIRVILANPPDGGGYRSYALKTWPNATEREEDIEQLADYASGFDNLEVFLSELALLQSFSVEETVAADEPDEKVTLSSVHQAKGLEWGRVFLPWLVEGRFPSDLALREQGGEEEERRLFYVAVTRAKDEVFLTYPQVHRGRDAHQTLMRRSRFVEELPEPEEIDGLTYGLYEQWQIEEIDADMAELEEADDASPFELKGRGAIEDVEAEPVEDGAEPDPWEEVHRRLDQSERFAAGLDEEDPIEVWPADDDPVH
jgi:DNA helicase-2/ATP-dependent DNA helicase PcrA